MPKLGPTQYFELHEDVYLKPDNIRTFGKVLCTVTKVIKTTKSFKYEIQIKTSVVTVTYIVKQSRLCKVPQSSVYSYNQLIKRLNKGPSNHVNY